MPNPSFNSAFGGHRSFALGLSTRSQAITLVIAATVCFSPILHANDDVLLIGKWQLVDPENTLPSSCRYALTEFRSNGTVVSLSGENVSQSKYKITPFRKGYLLKEKFISDNGKPNCQRLDSKYVKEHTPSSVYIEVSNIRMKIFVVGNYEEPLMTFARVDARRD
jgi:hypothetical protein